MRKIVVAELLSLDGVAEEPNRFFPEWDDVLDANIPRLIATQDAVILGRRTYDEWVGFWPTSDIEPFATFINGVAKYVATSEPLEPHWTNAHVIDGDLVEFARRLKDGLAVTSACTAASRSPRPCSPAASSTNCSS